MGGGEEGVVWWCCCLFVFFVCFVRLVDWVFVLGLFFVFEEKDDSHILIETLLRTSLIYWGLTENMELCYGFADKSFQ